MNNQQTTSSAQAGARIAQPDLFRLTVLFTDRGEREQARLLQDFLCHAIGLLNAAGAVLFFRQGDAPAPAATLLSRQALAWAPDMEERLAATARQAMAGEQALCQPLAGQPSTFLMACPLAGARRPSCLTMVFRAAPGGQESFLVIGQLLAAILHLQLERASGPEPAPLDDLGSLVAEALQAEGREGLLHLTAGLRRLAGCSRVALGFGRKGRIPLIALSDVSAPDRRTEQSRILEKGFAECASRSALLRWPAPAATPELDSPVLAEVGRATGSGCVAALPLPAGPDTWGCLLLLWQEQPDMEETGAILSRLEKAGPLLAACIRALRQRPWRMGRGSRDSSTGSGRRRRIGLAAACLALGLLLLLPVPYRVPAGALVRPVTTRYVVARFDTILDKVLVEPGDRVRAGDLLALLDGREITLQLAGLTAERDKAARMYDQHLAAGETSAAQVARLDMERLDQQINLLRERQQHLRLVSPVDGMVLTGDLKRAEGGPVSKGQTLFEVAPLERMDIELAIGEEEIARVRPGAGVVIRFDAYPDQRWQGSVARIIPKSRIRDMRNVFIAEFETANPGARLRPGMRGEAEIDCGRRSLGWILLHRPWYTLLHFADRFL